MYMYSSIQYSKVVYRVEYSGAVSEYNTLRYGDMNEERTTIPASANNFATSETLRNSPHDLQD